MVLTAPEAPSRRRVRTVSAVVVFLFVVVALSLLMRVAMDVPSIREGTTPSDEFAERYVAHPWLGYLHLAPGPSPNQSMFGVAFLLGFSMHVAFGEWCLRRTPGLNG